MTDEISSRNESEMLSPEAESADDATAAGPFKELESRCAAAEEEAKQNYERLLRVSAEFENYKKRAQKEMADYRKYANELLLTELLSIVDNLERAIESTGDDNHAAEGVIKGVEMTLKSLHKIFEKFSVKFIDAVGKPFDPNFHQAMLQEVSDEHPEHIVIREFQKGYLLHDRLLRPSMVVISKGAEASKQPS